MIARHWRGALALTLMMALISTAMTVSDGAAAAGSRASNSSTSGSSSGVGWLEICKNGFHLEVGLSFPFTINGGPLFTVLDGQCSQPFEVPAGTATIGYTAGNKQIRSKVTSSVGCGSPSGPVFHNHSVTVPVCSGGVNFETVVTFTYLPITGTFRVCTAETSGANLDNGQPFVFDYVYSVDGTFKAGSVTLTNPVTGSNCSGPKGPIAVLNADGSAVTISVSEEQPSTASVELSKLQYQGGGTVISSPSLPTAVFPATVVFSLGTGENVETFTQGKAG